MNIEQLRESLKLKWVKYYFQNRPWLVKMRIWGTYDGERRPSSGFILATLSVLEPELDEILPLLLELNNNPDCIVTALGLNFNPEEQLHLLEGHNNDDVEVETVQEKRLSETSTNTYVDSQPQVSLSSKTLHLSQKHLETNAVVKQDIGSRVSTQVHNQKKSGSSLTVVNKLESRGTSVPALAVINRTNNGKALPALAVIGKAESNIKPTSTPLLTVISKTENSCNSGNNSKPVRSLLISSNINRETQPVSSVIPNSKLDSKTKLALIPPQDLIDNVNSAPTKQNYKLASWVDDFCQGARWDKDEAIYIPY
ncbi:DUF5331 domain-containing protein [Pelatocladus sp. BLCC-F211]|uniref:DUF5331 domain-containing protein n=1 Tax=Pelatocladus sp. BLCC-F211 TaxID=3342752 RepID=UPI0035B941E1